MAVVPSVTQLRTMLTKEESVEQLVAALPGDHTPDAARKIVVRMTRVVMTAVQKNSNLLECTPQSICAAVIEATELGLEITGNLALAYLVPYWDRKVKPNVRCAQLQIGYLGFMQLVLDNETVTHFTAEIVYQNDDFEYQLGSAPLLRHKPAAFGTDRGDMIGAYATATLTDGTVVFRAMDRKAIEKHRALCKDKNQTFWVNFEEWMWMKTAIKQLIKLLPCKPLTLDASMKDELRETGKMEGNDYIDVEATPTVPMPSGIDDYTKDQKDDTSESEPTDDAPSEVEQEEIKKKEALYGRLIDVVDRNTVSGTLVDGWCERIAPGVKLETMTLVQLDKFKEYLLAELSPKKDKEARNPTTEPDLQEQKGPETEDDTTDLLDLGGE